jgi:hypothetical protein
MKRASLVFLALAVVACGKKENAAAISDSSASSSREAPVVLPPVTLPMPASVSAQQGAKPACPHDGKWALCSVENRLRQAGFVVKHVDSTSARRKGFAVAPAVYSLGQARLEIFLYADSAAMAKDMMALDTAIAGPRGAPSQWGDIPPVLIRSANLAAVFLGSSPVQVERLTLAITAGPPMAGSPR